MTFSRNKSRLFTGGLALVLVALALSSHLSAQQAEPSGRTVELSVIVDKKSIPSIRKEDVHVFEDKIEQTVLSFGVDDRPVDCGLLIDATASMRKVLSASLEAARLVVVNRRPEDQFFISRFVNSDNIQTVQDFTSDADLLVKGLGSLETSGGPAALIDALYLGAEHVAKHNANNPGRRKVLVVITDGEDGSSNHKFEHLLKLLNDRGVQVFALGFTSHLRRQVVGEPMPAAKDEAEEVLRIITASSGGRVFFPKDKNDLVEAVTQLLNDLHSQFRLTYQSASNKKGFRKVEVKLTPAGGEKLVAVVPRGYYVEK